MISARQSTRIKSAKFCSSPAVQLSAVDTRRTEYSINTRTASTLTGRKPHQGHIFPLGDHIGERKEWLYLEPSCQSIIAEMGIYSGLVFSVEQSTCFSRLDERIIDICTLVRNANQIRKPPRSLQFKTDDALPNPVPCYALSSPCSPTSKPINAPGG